MLSLYRMCIVWCLVGMYLTTADTTQKCVRFTINSSGDGRELTVEENTTRTITFEVNNTCPDLDDVTVVVSRGNGSPSDWKHLCRVSQERKSANCKCEKSDLGQLCNATDTFTRHRAQWRLRGTDNSITILGEEIFNVSVTYPTTITKFVLATEDTHLEVDENKEPGVQVRCEWQEGNPQRRIHIRKDGDEPLQTMETADRRLSTLVHNIRPVRCSDSGLYSCEAEGSDQHRTVTMLVRCPLQFTNGGETETVTVLPGETTEFQFSVLSYTSTISSCTLTRAVTTQNQDNTISCMSSRSEVVVIGSPPHLTLRLRLKNVEQQDEGTWRMRVDNGFTRQASVRRQADVDFTLRVVSLSSKTFSVATTTSDITTTPGGHVPVETEMHPLNIEDPKPSVDGLTMVSFCVSIIAVTGIVVIIVTLVSLYVCVVLKRIGNHVTLPTRQQDAVVEVPGRECQGQGDSSQQEHVYEEVAEPLPRSPFCFRVRISSRPPATLPRPCAPSLSHTGLRPIATPTQAKNNQSAELSCPDTFLQPTTTPTQYENNQSAEPYCPDTYLHPNAAPIEHENNQSAEPSCPDTYLHPIATLTPYENNQSADPSCPDMYLHSIATSTECVNNQSAEPSCPDTYLHPIATPTEYENNQSAEPSYPNTYLHHIATHTEYENNQSAEPSCPDTYLHPIATPTEYENNQSADCLELDEGGYLKPMDLLQKQLICQTKV